MQIKGLDLLEKIKVGDEEAIAKFWNANAKLFVEWPERRAARRRHRLSGAFDPVSEANFVYFSILSDKENFPETAEAFEQRFKKELLYITHKEAKYQVREIAGRDERMMQSLSSTSEELDTIKAKLFGERSDVAHPDYKLFLEDLENLALSAISKLSKDAPQRKEVLRLYYIEGLSYEEIEKKLGSGVGNQLNVGRREIYKLYDIVYPDDELPTKKREIDPQLLKHHENIKLIFAPNTGIHGIKPLREMLQDQIALTNPR